MINRQDYYFQMYQTLIGSVFPINTSMITNNKNFRRETILLSKKLVDEFLETMEEKGKLLND